MGSQGGIVPPAENRDEVTVMVTGFAVSLVYFTQFFTLPTSF